MTSPGTQLRLERERQKKSLEQLATETRIASKYLDALEHDEPQLLPGQFFYRTWSKQYASVLGIDDEQFAAAVDSLSPNQEVDVLKVLSHNYQPLQKTFHRPRMSAKFAAALLVGTGLAGSAAFGVWSTREDLKVSAASTPPVPAPSEVPPGRVDPEPVAAPSSNLTNEPTEVADPAPAPAKSDGALELRAREKTWVSVTASGRTVFAGTLDANESRHFDMADGGRLLTGNAAGLSVTWNGRELGELGPAGQVRVVVLDGESARVLAKRMSGPVGPANP